MPDEASLGEPRSEQVNIRLTKREHDVVQALIFLGEGSSATDVLRNAVSNYLLQQDKDEDVTSALAALARRRARKEGKLASIRRKAKADAEGA
jgi:Arc/MetJ-type ribon-helix-helix transcriptional regulator